MLYSSLKQLLILTVFVLLTACGGGGGGGGGGNNDNPSDSTPDAFSFSDQVNVDTNTIIESNAITVSGIDTGAAINISGGEYSIDGSAYTNSTGTVNNGQNITIRQTSSADFSTTTDAVLTIGGISGTFSITTLAADLVPDVFSFVNQTNVPVNSIVASNTITVSGINGLVPIGVTGGEYSINGSPYGGPTTGMIGNGETVTVRQISSSSFSTQTDAILTIGGVSATFSVTTLSDNQAPIAAIQFPPTNSLTDDSTILVRGTAGDLGGSEIISVQVNGVEATSDNGFTTWQAQLELQPGQNVINVEATDSEQNQSTGGNEAQIRFEERLINRAYKIVFDDVNNRALVREISGQLAWINLSNGNRELLPIHDIDMEPARVGSFILDMPNNRLIGLISGALRTVDLNTGVSTLISNFDSINRSIALDSANNRILFPMTDGINLLGEINLDTGENTILSGENNGSGPIESGRLVSRVVVDSIANAAYVIAEDSSIYRVNLGTGDRSRFSPGFRHQYLRDMVLDQDNNRLLITDFRSPFSEHRSGVITSIDLNTGEHLDIFELNTEAGLKIFEVLDFAFNPQNNSLLLLDSRPEALMSVDIATGQQETIYDWTAHVGSGPKFGNYFGGLDLDEVNNRAFVMSRDLVDRLSDGADSYYSLFQVDLDSGDRQIVSGYDVGSGRGFRSPASVVLDAENNRAFVSDSFFEFPFGHTIFSVDLSSGDRTDISSNSVGSGPHLFKPNDIVFDAENNRLLVINFDYNNYRWLMSVDLTSGVREVISSRDIGSGVEIDTPLSLALNEADNSVLVLDWRLDALIRIDLNTGDRTVVSSEDVGNGRNFESPQDIYLDTANNRALVADAGDSIPPFLLSINLETGDREFIPYINNASFPSYIKLDNRNNNIYVLDDYLSVIDIVNNQWVVKSK